MCAIDEIFKIHIALKDVTNKNSFGVMLRIDAFSKRFSFLYMVYRFRIKDLIERQRVFGHIKRTLKAVKLT